MGTERVLAERNLRNIEAFLEMFPGVERVMIDGTERPIQRPQEVEQQTLNYFGKKRRHTRKHLAVVAPTQRVLVLSKAREGNLHDKRLEAEEEIAFHSLDDIPIEVDLGFPGLQSEYTNLHIPHKKPRGGELTDEQKQENRTLSQARVVNSR